MFGQQAFGQRQSPRMCQSPKGDKIATKYCFRAKCHLVDFAGRRLGWFIAYDKSPTIAKDVLLACKVSLESFPKGCACDDDVDMVMLPECPVECIREVRYEPKNKSI